MTKILACIDASLYGQSVCDHAAWAAKRSAAGIELLHALDRTPDAVPTDLSGSIGLGAKSALLRELTEIDERRGKLRQERGHALLGEAAERVRAEGITDIVTRLRHSSLVEAVLDEETDASLVVLGKRGEAADFARGHIGGSVEQVVRACHHPVLVASRNFKPVERVLVAYDGGASARKALDAVADEPLFAGLAVDVLMAGEVREADAHLDWARERLRGREGVTIGWKPGKAEIAIADQVNEAGSDLLVMGAYGHGQLRQLIVGSTTTALVRTCRIPVMLYR